jgi:hypothetical protein
MDKRKKLVELLRVESVRPRKFTRGDKQVVVMPSPIQKKDLTDYTYGMDIDEKVVKMACKLAERMAITMVRESLGHINTAQITETMLDSLVSKIVDALPDQQTVIQQVVSQETEELKKKMNDLVFEGAEVAIDRSKGLKLHGDIGEKTKTSESTDDALDALDNLEL